MTTQHTASRQSPPAECFADTVDPETLNTKYPCPKCNKPNSDLRLMDGCRVCGGTGTATIVDPETLKATIRQMHEALRMALKDWPVEIDGSGLPRFYRQRDSVRIDQLRAACEAADKLPRSVRG